jgi:hypothetical protein
MIAIRRRNGCERYGESDSGNCVVSVVLCYDGHCEFETCQVRACQVRLKAMDAART